MARGTMQRCCDIERGRPGEVLPCDIFNLHLRRFAGVGRSFGVDTLRDLDRQADICELEVLEGDIADETGSSAASVAVSGSSHCLALLKVEDGAVSGWSSKRSHQMLFGLPRS